MVLHAKHQGMRGQLLMTSILPFVGVYPMQSCLFFPLLNTDLLILSPFHSHISFPSHFLSFSFEVISWLQPQVSHGIDFA